MNILTGKEQIEKDHHPLLELFLMYCIYTYLTQLISFSGIKNENFFGPYDIWPQQLSTTYEQVMNNISKYIPIKDIRERKGTPN